MLLPAIDETGIIRDLDPNTMAAEPPTTSKT